MTIDELQELLNHRRLLQKAADLLMDGATIGLTVGCNNGTVLFLPEAWIRDVVLEKIAELADRVDAALKAIGITDGPPEEAPTNDGGETFAAPSGAVGG